MPYGITTYGSLSTGAIQIITPEPLPGDAAQAINDNAKRFRDAIFALETAPAIWGSITGSLSAQTDLSSALNLRLLASNNLSDLPSPSAARSALGLGSAATSPTTAFDTAGAATAALAARTVATTAPMTGGGALSSNLVLAVPPFVPAGPSHSPGLVPDPGATTHSPAYVLTEGGWAAPSGGGGGGAWGSITGTLADQTDLNTALGAKVSTSRTITTTVPLSGGGTLSSDLTLAIASFIPAGTGHAPGTVPDPGATIHSPPYVLTEGGWAAPATGSSTLTWGSITGTLAAQTDLDTALSSKAPTTRTITTTAPLSGGGSLASDLTLAISDFQPAGTGHAKGAVPDPGATTHSPAYVLTEGGWAAPSGGGGGGAWGSITGTLSAQTDLNTALGAKVPASRSIMTTAPLSGGGDLSADLTLMVPDFIAAGASHASGLVPDPGATTHSPAYVLTEAGWAASTGGGGGAVWGSITGTLSDQTDLANVVFTNVAATFTAAPTFQSVAPTFQSGNTAIDPTNRTQFRMGYYSGGGYNQLVTTTHNASSGLNNSINFFTSDGTSANTPSSGSIHGLTITNGCIGVAIFNPTVTLDINGPMRPKSYAVSTLPTPSADLYGAQALAFDALKAGESSGAGTGLPVWCDGTDWRNMSNNIPVSA